MLWTQLDLPPLMYVLDEVWWRLLTNLAKSSSSLVVIGSAAVDITAQTSKNTSFALHSTIPGSVTMTLGGVARNMAEAAHRTLAASSLSLARATVLISAIGDDSFGRLLTEESKQMGMRTDDFIVAPMNRTAVCNMVLDAAGSLTGGIADMDVIQSLDANVVSG